MTNDPGAYPDAELPDSSAPMTWQTGHTEHWEAGFYSAYNITYRKTVYAGNQMRLAEPFCMHCC